MVSLARKLRDTKITPMSELFVSARILQEQTHRPVKLPWVPLKISSVLMSSQGKTNVICFSEETKGLKSQTRNPLPQMTTHAMHLNTKEQVNRMNITN